MVVPKVNIKIIKYIKYSTVATIHRWNLYQTSNFMLYCENLEKKEKVWLIIIYRQSKWVELLSGSELVLELNILCKTSMFKQFSGHDHLGDCDSQLEEDWRRWRITMKIEMDQSLLNDRWVEKLYSTGKH